MPSINSDTQGANDITSRSNKQPVVNQVKTATTIIIDVIHSSDAQCELPQWRASEMSIDSDARDLTAAKLVYFEPGRPEGD